MGRYHGVVQEAVQQKVLSIAAGYSKYPINMPREKLGHKSERNDEEKEE